MNVTSGKPISISFVIPCLNEEATLPFVLEKIVRVCKTDLIDYKSEIIVADNGSQDQSVETAKAIGARVVQCPTKGYGAELKCGIKSAENEIIVCADADDTYDFLETPKLIKEIEKGYDFIIGSRLKGDIHKGAMPFLHHYLGTPILNLFINSLYSRAGYKISDCNSGFRCFRKEVFNEWNIQSDGMEFASEMLVKSLKNSAKISEVPVSLYPDHPGRTPHLKTWRDGMRHLLRVFVEAPSFFNKVGISIFTMNIILLLISILAPDYVNFLGMSVFGIHTMMFALLGSLAGQVIWGIGLFISIKEDITEGLYFKVINLSEDTVFWLIFYLFLFSLLCFGGIIVYWASKGFVDLTLQKQTLFLITIAANGMLILANVFTAHLLKRS
jgi:glycosyltransferase involved in cell wall biosynthesis